MPTLFFSVAGDTSTYVPTCAVTLSATGTQKQWPLATCENGRELLEFLVREMETATLVSFGGASFGLRALRTLVPDAANTISRIAYDHVDLMHLFVVDNGYRAPLASFNATDASSKPRPSDAALDCERVVRDLEAAHAMACSRGVLMRTAKSGQIFPWFIRQELEEPPITLPTVRESLQRIQRAPQWIRDPLSKTTGLEWLETAQLHPSHD